MRISVFLRVAFLNIFEGFIHCHILTFYVIRPVRCIPLLHLQISDRNLLHSLYRGTEGIYLHLCFLFPDMIRINQRRENSSQNQQNIDNHQDQSAIFFLTVFYHIYHSISFQELQSVSLLTSLHPIIHTGSGSIDCLPKPYGIPLILCSVQPHKP